MKAVKDRPFTARDCPPSNIRVRDMSLRALRHEGLPLPRFYGFNPPALPVFGESGSTKLGTRATQRCCYGDSEREPVHCDKPSCDSAIEKKYTQKSKNEAQIQYRCPSCGTIYETTIYIPQDPDDDIFPW